MENCQLENTVSEKKLWILEDLVTMTRQCILQNLK